jgi:hypothetical protein
MPYGIYGGPSPDGPSTVQANADSYRWTAMISADQAYWACVKGYMTDTWVCSNGRSFTVPRGITGTVQSTIGLNLRFNPNGAVDLPSAGETKITLPYGTTLRIACFWRDLPVTGPWGTTDVWDGVVGYTTPGGTSVDLLGDYFVSDSWVFTGGDSSQQGLPPCYGIG